RLGTDRKFPSGRGTPVEVNSLKRMSSIKIGKYCVECGETITGTLYSFAGTFACEPCVRAYYVERGHSKSAIAEELKCRAYLGSELVKVNKQRRRHDDDEDS